MQTAEAIEAVQRIDRETLGPEAQRVLDAVRGGQTALIERRGEPEAAILDIVDYRILRAVAHYQAHPPQLTDEDLDAGLTDADVAALDDPQARYDVVLAYFLAGSLSLSRAAELLGTVYIDLRIRFHRLGLPTRQGPATIEEAREEVRVAAEWLAARRP
ncbi:MAG: hypothetical protein ACRDI2_03845 [Chloroflexota bacterium]